MNIYYTCESGFASKVLSSAHWARLFAWKNEDFRAQWDVRGRWAEKTQPAVTVKNEVCSQDQLEAHILSEGSGCKHCRPPRAPRLEWRGEKASSRYFFSGSSHLTSSAPQSLLWHLCFATWRWIDPPPTVLLHPVSLFFPFLEALRPAISLAGGHSQS